MLSKGDDVLHRVHSAESLGPAPNTEDEFVLHLVNGNTIRTSTYSTDDSGCDYVRVCDPERRGSLRTGHTLSGRTNRLS